MEPDHDHIHPAFTQVEDPGCKGPCKGDLECERHEWKFWVRVGSGGGAAITGSVKPLESNSSHSDRTGPEWLPLPTP